MEIHKNFIFSSTIASTTPTNTRSSSSAAAAAAAVAAAAEEGPPPPPASFPHLHASRRIKMYTKDGPNLLFDTRPLFVLTEASKHQPSEPVNLLRVLSALGGGTILPGRPGLFPRDRVCQAFPSPQTTKGTLPTWALPGNGLPEGHSLANSPIVDAAPHPKRLVCANRFDKQIGIARDLIDTLPDELLCQIFCFLPSPLDRSACASVSRRWLMLLSHMPKQGWPARAGYGQFHLNVQEKSNSCVIDEERQHQLDHFDGGDLSRTLAGKRVSDVRLAAIAVGTAARGGLGKLCIRGGSSAAGVTDVGVSAIGISCSSLRVLSLWGCRYITNEGLSVIAKGCPLLEKLDLFKCPQLGDAGLQTIARNCVLLSFLSIDSCERFGNRSLIAFGNCCPSIVSLSIRNCPLVDDDGFVVALNKLRKLKMLKLGGLKLSNRTLASIGQYSQALTWLNLHSLDFITTEGFAYFGKGIAINSLKRILITSCKHFADEALAILGTVCRNLRNVFLSKCDSISDKGLAEFMKVTATLEVLRIENCSLITGMGLVAALTGTARKLKDIQVRKCRGIKEVKLFYPSCFSNDSMVDSICLANCPGVSDLYLAQLGWLCPQTTKLDFTGLTDITDKGMIAFLSTANRKLISVNVSGCVQLTDLAICAIVNHCGDSLRNLVLDGCKMISNKALKAIASQCKGLEDLDLSMCAISNEGVKWLVEATGNTLSSLNLSGCDGVTDKVLSFIQKNCKSLLDLNVKNCRGMTERYLLGFESRMQRCDILY